MQIKQAITPDERKAVYEIRKSVFVDEQHVPIEEEMDEFEEEAIHFICYKEGHPVGASRLRLFTDYGKLERMAVLNEHRGQSIGSKLIQAMESELAAQKVTLSKLSAQTHAIAFYQALGYKIVSEEYMDAGIPHVTMTKPLTLKII